MSSKKELASALYQALVAEGVADKDMRKTFIARACLEPMNMTPAGASTYYVNAKTTANGGEVKTYRPSSAEKKVSQAVDDSKESAPIWSVVSVENLAGAGGKFSGKIETVHGFMSQESAVKRYNRLNDRLRAKCVVVEGSPYEGTELSTCVVVVAK